MSDPKLIQALRERGVVIHAPDSILVEGIDPTRIESGVELYPGCVLRGRDTLLGRGCRLGRAGGGSFENVRAGRNVDLYGGTFQDAVFLDGVIVRGHAEMRGGTLMEEESEAAHHVGYKMTITMPWVIAGSLVNFCDALIAGGTGRRDHSELGSALALYNFTPRGDKFASLFGDVPRGVFLRSERIFVGGQAQIVSPVKVGYGAVIVAGGAVRRSVPAGRLYGEAAPALDRAYVSERYGSVERLIRLSAEYVANLWALDAWYERVRLPGAPPFHRELYAAARAQVRAGISERIKRLDRLVDRLPRSLELHREALASAAGEQRDWHQRCVDEHEQVRAGWAAARASLASGPATDGLPERGSGLEPVVQRFTEARRAEPDAGYLDILGRLTDAEVSGGEAELQRIVAAVLSGVPSPWSTTS
ncbi:MAG: UDP-N-acetylglucosamine pyrophosphorylase [bacterium]